MIELVQQQVQQLSHQQIQSLNLLQMSAQVLEEYIRNLAQENPMLDLTEIMSSEEGGNTRSDAMLEKLHWPEENDIQNRFYQHLDWEETDPINMISTAGGLEETLVRFVSRQMSARPDLKAFKQPVCYLASCLDQNGYLFHSIKELAPAMGVSLETANRALEILRSLEPAGIGAESLAQCLELQLDRIGITGPVCSIVHSYLGMLAKGQYNSIAKSLSVSREEVLKALDLIRELEPRPGAVFESSEPVCYIRPDVVVQEENGTFVAKVQDRQGTGFQVNPYYLKLLKTSEDQEVRTYLNDHYRQICELQVAVQQRENTLKRCADYITERQQDFFRLGSAALRPMTMQEAADRLEVSNSTISRAVKDKYLQCRQGLFPLRFFYSASVSSETDGAEVSGAAARAMVERLIREEDKAHPLSDQALAREMTRLGCPIARRTAAKYREELQIPNTSARRSR